jgi:hypothetical protein
MTSVRWPGKGLLFPRVSLLDESAPGGLGIFFVVTFPVVGMKSMRRIRIDDDL